MSEKNEVSRAEMVRLRREREQTQRLQRAVKETARPVPVTTRTRASKPGGRNAKPRQNARRRFQIAVPAMPRARALSLPRPRFGWRALSLLLAGAFGVLIYLAFRVPQLRVGEAEVTGNQVLTPSDVNAVLNIAGQPVFLLAPWDLETRLRLNYPELAAVDVQVALPNRVLVHLTERKPVIRWEQGDGYTWISEDGVAFKPRGELTGLIPVVAVSAPTGGPAVSDPLNPAPFITPDMVQAIQSLAGNVPPGMSILYDGRLGFGWNDPRGWRVYFGPTSQDMALKLRVYESMVASLTQRGIRPALINVTYPTAPYYRLTP